MQEWLQPVKSIPSLTYDGIAAAVTQLKQYTEDMQKVPRGLITTMRILRSLSVAPHRKYPDGMFSVHKGYRYTWWYVGFTSEKTLDLVMYYNRLLFASNLQIVPQWYV